MRGSREVVRIDAGDGLPPVVSPVPAVQREPTLFDWVRQYAALVLLAAILGVAAGGVYERLAPPEHEAWVILVEEAGGIEPRQLGPAAQAIFRSRPVYGPVMEALGIRGSAASFLDDSVELRPVPDTPVLMVVGRSADPQRAGDIAERMALSLETALRDAEVAGFRIFNDPQPVAATTGFADPAIVAAGAGIWIGVAIAVIHYRLRRPVLSTDRAVGVSGAEDVVSVRRGRIAWLGVLAPPSVRPRGWLEADRLARVLTRVGRSAVLFLPGFGRRREAKLRDGLWSLVEPSGSAAEGVAAVAERAVFVCSPTTSVRDLHRAALAAQAYDRPALLVWVE